MADRVVQAACTLVLEPTRTTRQIRDLFTGFDLVAPGLVPVTDWRHPDEQDDGVVPPVLADVGRKP